MGKTRSGKSDLVKAMVHKITGGLIFFDTEKEVNNPHRSRFRIKNAFLCRDYLAFIGKFKLHGANNNYVCRFMDIKEYDFAVNYLRQEGISYILIVDEFGTFVTSHSLPASWKNLTLTHRHGAGNSEKVLFFITQSPEFIHRSQITTADHVFCFGLEKSEIDILASKISLTDEQKVKIERLPPRKYITLK